MINSACRGSASYSIRSRPDPYGGLTHPHNPVQYRDLCDVSQCCACSQCGKMLDGEMLGQLFLEFLSLCPRARHHKVDTVSEDRHGNCARMMQTRRKLARVVSHRCHGSLTRNIEALCSVLRSVHCFVQNCVTTRTLVVLSWHLDHDRTTCRAVKMRSADVSESQNFLSSRCSPLASHAPTVHDLEACQWRCGCQRANRVFWCQLADSLGFLRNQPCSDEWVRGVTHVRVDPSCPDGFQSRLVQTPHRNFMVDS